MQLEIDSNSNGIDWNFAGYCDFYLHIIINYVESSFSDCRADKIDYNAFELD